MAYGNYKATAMQDGVSNDLSRKRKELAEYNANYNPTPAQEAVNRDWERQQAEAKWAAEQEAKKRQEAEEDRLAQQRKAAAKNRIAEQRAADQAAAQQDAQNDAWKNVIDYSEPSNLTSNGQTITNTQTGQTYVTPNNAQINAEKQAQRQEEERQRQEAVASSQRLAEQARQEQMKRERELAMEQLRQQELARQAELERQRQEQLAARNRAAVQQAEEEANQVTPATTAETTSVEYPPYGNRQNALEDVVEQPDTQSYKDALMRRSESMDNAIERSNSTGMSPEQADIINQYFSPVSPRVYDPKEIIQNLKDAGIPVDQATNMNDLYNLWQTYLANQAAVEAEDNAWGNVVEDQSVLAPNVTPVTPQSQEEWLQTPEGQAALANEQAKKANDAMLRSNITPNLADESGTETPVLPYANDIRGVTDALRDLIENVTRPDTLEPIIWGGAAQPSANGYPDVTPEVTTETDAEKPSILDAWLLSRGSGNGEPSSEEPEGSTKSKGGVSAPSFGDTLQGILDDWLLSRNGNTTPDSEVIDNYRDGTQGEQRYDARHPKTIADEQADYILNPNTGPQMPESSTPSMGDVVRNMLDDFLLSRKGTEQDTTPNATESDTPSGLNTPSFGDVIQNMLDEWLLSRTGDRSSGNTPSDSVTPNRDSSHSTGGGSSANGDGTRDWEKNPPKSRDEVLQLYLEQTGKNPNDITSEDLFEINAIWNNMYAPQASGNGTSGSTGSSSGINVGKGKPPKGYETYQPSYKQGGQVVKAPYKVGGYTDSELEAMGNRPYENYRGTKSYEGYYQAPDGAWYPVDQQKAEYYQQYHTYNGWEEPMREYFDTFGTFSGYTPTWKETGKNYAYLGGYNPNRGGNYSYSGGGSGGSGGSSSRSNGRSSGYSYTSNGGYTGNYNSNVQPELTNQTKMRINNIMRNWTF